MRHFLTMLALITASAVQADIPRPSNLDETLALMLDHLRADFPDARIQHETRNITLDADKQMILNPDNLHAVLQTIDNGAAREAELERFLDTVTASLSQAPLSEGLPLERVYPVIRHESLAGDGQEDASLPLSQPFIGDMILVYAIHYPDHVAYVTSSYLNDNQVTETQLNQAADLNLIQKVSETGFQHQNGMYFVVTDGFYESSIILHDALWADVSRQLNDDWS